MEPLPPESPGGRRPLHPASWSAAASCGTAGPRSLPEATEPGLEEASTRTPPQHSNPRFFLLEGYCAAFLWVRQEFGAKCGRGEGGTH